MKLESLDFMTKLFKSKEWRNTSQTSILKAGNAIDNTCSTYGIQLIQKAVRKSLSMPTKLDILSQERNNKRKLFKYQNLGKLNLHRWILSASRKDE